MFERVRTVDLADSNNSMLFSSIASETIECQIAIKEYFIPSDLTHTRLNLGVQGQLELGVRTACRRCGDELRVPSACKNRGCCPSCMGRRMAEGAALLVDHVLPAVGYRRWRLYRTYVAAIADILAEATRKLAVYHLAGLRAFFTAIAATAAHGDDRA